MASRLYLPEELEIEILLRLPAKSVLLFKRVSKRWQSIIVTPSFISRYNTLSRVRNDNKLLCFRKEPITDTHVASLHDHKTFEKIQDLEFPPFVDDEILYRKGLYGWNQDIKIYGPINGTYCIIKEILGVGGTLVLWNPATESYKHIHPPILYPYPMELQGYDVGCPISLQIGFGYDDNINDYKIVVICHWDLKYEHPPSDRWHVRVYNNATESWSTICNNLEICETKNLAFPYVNFYSGFSNCYLNGIHHWSCGVISYGTFENDYHVLAFDMASETFKVMRGHPILPDLNDSLWFMDVHPSVWVLRDTISLVTTFSMEEKVEVWIMKEYGVEDSWTLLKTIEFGSLKELRVVGIPNDEEILFDDTCGQLISFDLEDDNVIEHGIFGMSRISIEYDDVTLGVLNYMETLAPVKTFVL